MSRQTRTDLEPDPVIEAYKADVDMTIILENLRLSHEERLRKLMDLQEAAVGLRRARFLDDKGR